MTILRQELVDVTLLHQDQGFYYVGQVKAVEMNHDREENVGMLTNAKGTQRQVESLLPIFGEHLNPAAVSNCHNIRVVTPNA